MTNRIRVFGLVIGLGWLLLLPATGCLEEDPYYPPQGLSEGERGPGGTAAFMSGEASKTGMKPVKEGARVTDAGSTGGDDAGGTIGKDLGQSEEPEEDVDDGTGGPDIQF